MSVFATARTIRRLSRSQWLDSDGIRALQTRKLRALIDHAYATVPYRMTMNGEQVAARELREAIKTAALKQGKELADQALKGIVDAAQHVRKELAE